MARLVWGAMSERFFEIGVDRGVLYPFSGIGVAWQGLLSVNEAPTGGEARPYYLDGIKFLNIASAEEFEATLTVLSTPAEFALCDGIVSVHNGLFATQQPRQSFGLSYRSLIGNDVDREDHAYKIHLVYNALARPASRTNTSIGGSTNPMQVAWAITTLPPAVTGLKRTSHFVIDSRYTDPEVLSDFEDLLYGTEGDSPSMPTPDELIAIFE